MWDGGKPLLWLRLTQQPDRLQGCYVDRDGVTSKYWTLLRDLEPELEDVPVVFSGPTRANVARPANDDRLNAMPGRPQSPCTGLADCTKEDVDIMTSEYSRACSGAALADRLLQLLELTSLPSPLVGPDANLGAQVTLYEHGLQTATRALQDGASEEWIVTALLHDVGELLSPSNHGSVIAGILEPYVSPACTWTLAHHEVRAAKRCHPPFAVGLITLIRGVRQAPASLDILFLTFPLWRLAGARTGRFSKAITITTTPVWTGSAGIASRAMSTTKLA